MPLYKQQEERNTITDKKAPQVSFVRTNDVFIMQQLQQSLENLSYNTFNFNIQKYIRKEEFSRKKKKDWLFSKAEL